MTTTIEPGAIVVLKSGGPLMTVVRFEKDFETQAFTDIVVCSWFDNKGKLQYGKFPISSLKVEDPDSF